MSTATVSRFLNEPGRVSAKAGAKVARAIERNHYVSDGMAGGLASRRSKLIGVIIPTIANSIYALSTQAVQHAAQSAGYTVLVGAFDFDPEREAELIHKLLERRVEGLILTGARRAEKTYETIRHNAVPFAITWKLARGGDLPCVSFDNQKAAAKAVHYLHMLGHRRIGLICGRTDLNDRAAGRRSGFETSIRELGMEVDSALIHEEEFEFEKGREAMARMMSMSAPPTAVFCANDIQAIGALNECRNSGLSVPRDISIVGFDDLPISQYTLPQLTTIRVPAVEMGRAATEAVIQAIDGAGEVPRQELETELVVRGTTAAPKPR